jgi:CRP/FNR family transcriptional regulator, polysaccharide utilization system transcription regulator
MPNKFTPPECAECAVRCHSIFCDLGTDAIGHVNSIKDSHICRKGQIIFYEGNHPKGVYVIYSGKVKVSKLGSNAKEQIVRLARPGDVLGYRSLVSGDRYYASAAALEDSVICFIPKKEFFALLEKSGTLSMKLMKLLSNDLATAERKMVELVQKPVRERLAEALLILKEVYGVEKDGKTLNISLTREDIANFVGTTTETAIRLLSDFKDQHLIVLDKKKIIINDLPRLVRESHIND